jgi:superfamily II DNA or RNA helicase
MTFDTRVLGLTATPGRGSGLHEENEALAEFFFGAKVSLQAADGQSAIPFLREKRVLAKLDRELIETGVTVDATGAGQRLDVPSAILRELAYHDLRSAKIVGRLAELAEAGRSILVFGTSVEQSKFMVALLAFLGIDAAHLDGTSPRDERQHVIESFRTGRLSVLSNFGVLTTGFDAPKTDVICIARPTSSPVLYSQMLGRGLRGPAIGGTARCLVIDVRDNILGMPEVDDLYVYFDEYFED